MPANRCIGNIINKFEQVQGGVGADAKGCPQVSNFEQVQGNAAGIGWEGFHVTEIITFLQTT